MDVFISK